MNDPQTLPLQPVIEDKERVIRFRENAIVRVLLDRSGLSLDQLVTLDPSFSLDDQTQIAQLLGYPVNDTRFDTIRPTLPKTIALKKNCQQPMQPVIQDEHGVLRFRANAIVRALLDRDTERGKTYLDFPERSNGGLNWIAMQDFSLEDQEQFAQLIGYSISGYHELSYVSDESAAQASALAHEIMPNAGGCRDVGCPYHGGPLIDDNGRRLT